MVDSCANVVRRASPLAAVSRAFASSASVSRFLRALSLLASTSSLLYDGDSPLLDFRLLDRGGGDLDLDGERERDELLAIEQEGDLLARRFRLRSAPA